jgi:hypothetical protein
MDITATAGGLSLSMPSALQSSTGEDILVKNVGSNTFTLKDYSGGTITTVSAGAAIYVYLKDVSTAAGQWATVAFGVGSSSVNAASLVGYGIKAISASLNQSHPATTANVNFTIGASDRAQLYLTSVGITINLPAAIGTGNDFFFLVRNISTGNTTIDANGAELIDGAGTVVLAPEESCLVCCTGTTWYTVGRGRSTVFEYTQLTKNVAGNTNVTLTGAEASNSILKFIGALTGNINVIVPNVTAIWYVDNSTSGPYSLTVKTNAGTGISITVGNRVILYGDGVNVQSAQTVFATSGAFDTGSASVPSITFVSDTDTGAYNSGANQFGITVGGVQAANFSAAGVSITGALTLGTDLAVLQGGTGASDAPGARSNLGISATNTPNTPSGNLSATDVQGALNELQTDVDTRAVATTVVTRTSATGSAVIPSGTTAQQDGSPLAGYLRYNSTLTRFEGYNGTTWGTVSPSTAGGISFTASGNIVATDVQAAIQEVDTEKAGLGTANTFTGAQRGSVTALTSTAASIAINLATNNNFSHATTENTTLAAPSNAVAGQSGFITITQGATPRTLAYNTFYKFAGGTIPTLTATASATDVLAYYVAASNFATCQLIKDVKS